MDSIFDESRIEIDELDYDDNDSQSNSEDSLQSWINWFCSITGHDYYVEVPEDFIEDEFNLTGLSAIVPFYNEALEMILDIEPEEYLDEDEEDEENKDDNSDKEEEVDDGFWKEKPLQRRHKGWVDPNTVEPYAAMLYGLIHQRYLLTRNGLRVMAERYSNEQFGVCPRYYCYKCPVIPCGRYDEISRESIRLYCPSCMDLYHPFNSLLQNIDGAHFGTTYAHLMFETYPELVPKAKPRIYQPRIYGFRINEKSRSGPRMQWLRMRPDEYTDFDEEEDYEEDAEEADKPVNLLQAVDKKAEEEETSLTDKVEVWKVNDTTGINNILRRFF